MASNGLIESSDTTNPLFTDFYKATVEPGTPVAALIDPEWLDHTYAFINGTIVKDPASVVMQEGDEIMLCLGPAGGEQGKTIFASIAMIAITLAAGPIASAGFAAAGLTVSKAGLAYAAATAGITLVGSLAVGALIRPPTIANNPSFGQRSTVQRESQVYSFTGQSNQANLYGAIPSVYGRHRFYPPLAASPRVDTVGSKSVVTLLLDFGYGTVNLTNLRIGDTPLETYKHKVRIHTNSFGRNLKFVTDQTSVDQLQLTMVEDEWINLSTAQDSNSARLDITFPDGLARSNRENANQLDRHAVGLITEYAEAGTGNWKRVGAVDYRGVNVDNETDSSVAYYDYQGGGIDDEGDRWETSSYQDDKDLENDIRIWQNGVIKFSQRWRNEESPTSVVIDGKTWKRGSARDAYTEYDGEMQLVAYEVVVPEPIPDKVSSLTGKTANPFVATAEMFFETAGLYDVRVKRTTPVSTGTTLRDRTIVTALRSYREGAPIALEDRHTLMELQITANDQLSGVVDQVNADCSRSLDNFDATGFTGDTIDNGNQARVAMDIIAGKANKNPLKNSQIDFSSFNALKQICNERIQTKINGRTYSQRRYRWNGIIDNSMTVQEAVNAVLSTCRASFSLLANGKYGVVIDAEKDVPRQLITPANSWGFKGNRIFAQRPHAIKVGFVAADLGYQPSEIVVYDDGYDVNTATLIEDLSTYGITDAPRAWRYGRYMMAQGIFRSETFSVQMDIENLAIQRGDLVEVQHDVPLWGGLAARIVRVAGNDLELDREFNLPGGTGKLTGRRSADGAIVYANIINQSGTTVSVDSTSSLQVGDLVAFGDSSYETQQCIVTSIEPGADYTATVNMVQYVPEVYTADEGDIPDWLPDFDNEIIEGLNLKVVNLTATQLWDYEDGVPVKIVRLEWEVEGRSTYASAYIMAAIGEPESIGQAVDGAFIYDHRVRSDADAPWINEEVVYEVIPVSGLGVRGRSETITVDVVEYSERPLPPRNLHLDVQKSTLVLSWDFSLSPDVDRYVIRYTPVLESPMWSSAQRLGHVSANQNEFETNARTGTYMMRTYNTSGRASELKWKKTNIETLPDINQILSINDVDNATPWDGVKTFFATAIELTFTPIRLEEGYNQQLNLPSGWPNQIQLADTTVVDLETTAPSDNRILSTTSDWMADSGPAIYEFASEVDLGGIYEILLTDKSQASALNEEQFFLVATGQLTIADVDEDEEIDWNHWLEYAVETAPDIWSDWVQIRTGRITGQKFKFRYVARKDTDDIRVSIFDGLVELDVDDRQWLSNDVAIDSGGTAISFDPPFYQKPSLSVTTQGNAIRYEASAFTADGVTIQLFNASDNPVAGTVDIAAVGIGRKRLAIP